MVHLRKGQQFTSIFLFVVYHVPIVLFFKKKGDNKAQHEYVELLLKELESLSDKPYVKKNQKYLPSFLVVVHRASFQREIWRIYFAL